MQLTKISRSKSFEMVNGYGLKMWDKFSLDGELGDKEDPLNGYRELGKVIDSSFKESYPDLQEGKEKIVQVEKKEDATHNMIMAITSCTEEATLKTFEKLVKNNPIFQAAYDETMQLLINKK